MKIDERGDNCTIHHRCCSSIGKTFIKLPWSYIFIIYIFDILIYLYYLLLGSNNFEQSHICSRNNYLPNRSMPGYGYSTKPTEIFECTYATILNDHNENVVWILWNSCILDRTKIKIGPIKIQVRHWNVITVFHKKIVNMNHHLLDEIIFINMINDDVHPNGRKSQ